MKSLTQYLFESDLQEYLANILATFDTVKRKGNLLIAKTSSDAEDLAIALKSDHIDFKYDGLLTITLTDISEDGIIGWTGLPDFQPIGATIESQRKKKLSNQKHVSESLNEVNLGLNASLKEKYCPERLTELDREILKNPSKDYRDLLQKMYKRKGLNSKGKVLAEQQMTTKIITIECHDLDDSLEDMLNHLMTTANTGTHVTIVVDEDGDEQKKFGFDGDGGDSIVKIKVS